MQPDKAPMPFPPSPLTTGATPKPLKDKPVGKPTAVPEPGVTRPQARDAVRASSLQPGLAGTDEDIERAIRHAKMEQAIAKLMGPGLAMPGTMAFNEEQKQRWSKPASEPTRPPVAKASMQATTIESQTSQALQLQSPFGHVMQTVHDSIQWVSSWLSGKVDTHALTIAELAEMLELEFQISKKSGASGT